MPKSTFRGVRISGVAGAVPAQAVDTFADHQFCPEEDRRKIIDLTKVKSYRRAPAHVCASDLCQAAAESLLSATGQSAEGIDAVLFVSMTPDFRVPSTACLLQDRLGCASSAVAYDVNMGCSGYIVGLYNACSLITGAGLRRVLLLCGDTQTKLCHPEDKNVVFILGDGSIVTAGHQIDFTDRVEIGRRVILGGRNSSLWTHNRQMTKAITIGDYSYLGSEIRIAPGAAIPAKCIVGMGSVVSRTFTREYQLIAGVPAAEIRELGEDGKFLTERKTRNDLPDDI